MSSTPNANASPGSVERGEDGPNRQTAVKMWGTPTSRDWKDTGQPHHAGIKRNEKRGLLGAQAVANQGRMFPTPRFEGFDAGAHKDRNPDSMHAVAKRLAKAGLLPPPASGRTRNPVTTPADLAHREEENLTLNPDFVESLMGYPRGWTDI